jgi:hypothetical protein
MFQSLVCVAPTYYRWWLNNRADRARSEASQRAAAESSTLAGRKATIIDRPPAARLAVPSWRKGL